MSKLLIAATLALAFVIALPDVFGAEILAKSRKEPIVISLQKELTSIPKKKPSSFDLAANYNPLRNGRFLKDDTNYNFVQSIENESNYQYNGYLYLGSQQ
jgi:hypothetical protein